MKINKKKISPILIIFFIFVLLFLYIHSKINELPDYIKTSNSRIQMTQIDVATLYPGIVNKFFVEEGEYVKKDQILASVHASEIESQLEIAKATKQRAIEAKKRGEAETKVRLEQLSVANLDYNNAIKLKKQNLISNSELEKRLAQLKGQQASVDVAKAATLEATAAIEEAQANIDKVKNITNDMLLKSPINHGLTEYKIVQIGSVIPQGGKVISLLDYSNIFVNLYFPINTIGKIKIGDEVRIKINGVDAIFSAKISYIANHSQFTPKFVETKLEREKLVYAIKAKFPEYIAIKYHKILKSGLTCDGFVNIGNKKWPSNLKIKLPK